MTMTDENLRHTIAENIAFHRKALGLTQIELSEKINYSDKSVSKWERGDGIPDVPTLVQLSELFGVSVDALLHQPNEKEKLHSTPSRVNWKHFFISLLAVAGVWFLAMLTICMFAYLAPSLASLWTGRILCYALTGGFITFLVFACLWWEKAWIFIAVSGIDWGVALSVYITFSWVSGAAMVFNVASVLQLVTLLCYLWRCAAGHRWLIPYPFPV